MFVFLKHVDEEALNEKKNPLPDDDDGDDEERVTELFIADEEIATRFFFGDGN